MTTRATSEERVVRAGKTQMRNGSDWRVEAWASVAAAGGRRRPAGRADGTLSEQASGVMS